MIVLVVAVGVGARIFKNTMLSGATQANMSVKRMLFLGAVFGGIQVLMVSLGLALTWTIDNVWGMETVGGVYRMMALICLCLLMLKGLKESIHMKEFCECRAEPLSMKKWIIQAVTTGVEASVVGMSISYLNPDTLYDMVCVLCVSVLSAIAGLWYRYWIGIKGRRAVNLSGAVLLGIAGVYMMLH